MKLLKKKEEIPIREDGLTDYNYYIMTKKEKLFYIIIAAIVLFFIGYIFYHNVILSFLLAFLSLKFPDIRTKQIIEKRKQNLTTQFKDMLYAVASSLSAGRSIESALKEALNDMRIIYPDNDTDIMKELEYIVRGIEMNEPVEKMLMQFAERSHIEDVENFTDIFTTCKRTGGDLVQVIKSTSQTIGDKIEIKQEIETLISGKKFEFRILLIMPVALILLLSMTTADYMQPVFDTVIGNVVMTVAIILFGIAYFIGKKIMDINV